MASITIELDTPFITPDCSTKILRTIFELLLYNRRQIPFPYATFRMMVKKQDTADGANTSSVADVHAQKQREKAQHVVKCAEHILETLERILADHSAGELMVLFGKTIYTAKEAFVIKMPTVDANHFGANHRRKLESILRNTGLQLTQCDEFVTEQIVLGDTNVFVMVQLPISSEPVGKLYGMNMLDEYQLPRKCASYAIDFKLATASEEELSNSCCKQVTIYSEHTELSSDASAIDDTQKKEAEAESAWNNRWFLLDTVVNGFSLKSAKNNQLWK
ncbi:uncharacterized protein LOC118505779 [Anopheles stephensi]|uniref:Uncharacterized protein n=1 Tax=Anopheles stephensi TaxID=30069 RepID=A0A182Y9E4_ANOST|nr:uncharacterized protein LOC118505779 [Anopheles stephensi]